MPFIKISKFFLYLAPFAVFLVTLSTIFPYIVGKYVFFRTVVGLSFISFLMALVAGEKINFSFLKSPLLIAVFAFVLFFSLGGFLGVNPSLSFWSNFERGEGVLQLIFLFVFFFLMMALFKTKDDWKLMIFICLLAALSVIVYGVFAGLKYLDAETEIKFINNQPQKVLTGQGGLLYQLFKRFAGPDFRSEGFRFQGSIGNPAYLATYLIFTLFFAFYLLFSFNFELKFFKKWGLPLLILIFFIFFILAGTRGAFLGLIGGLFISFLYWLIVLKDLRKYLLPFLILAVFLISILIYFKDTELVKNLPGSRIFDISFKTDTFQQRLIVWKIAFEGFKERPIFGWGIENFSQVFIKYYNEKHYDVQKGFGAWYDRAHNVFLDYLIAGGILTLLSYLSIFIVFIFNWLKTAFSKLKWQKNIVHGLFLIPLIGYLIQGMVLFDTLPIYIELFVFLALANFYFQELKTKNETR